jgi:hypothetical protein
MGSAGFAGNEWGFVIGFWWFGCFIYSCLSTSNGLAAGIKTIGLGLAGTVVLIILIRVFH